MREAAPQAASGPTAVEPRPGTDWLTVAWGGRVYECGYDGDLGGWPVREKGRTRCLLIAGDLTDMGEKLNAAEGIGQ